MRPYLVLTAVVLMAVAAFGQLPFRPGYGPCDVYGCGPFIPLLTTPEVSLQQFSPNPVGASNATTGLIAGATNSTLSQTRGIDQFGLYRGRVVPGRRSADHAGGPPVAGDDWTRRSSRCTSRCTRRCAKNVHEKSVRGKAVCTGKVCLKAMAHAKKRAATGPSSLDGSTPPMRRASAKGFKKAARVYNNGDVTRQNDKNGTVKYDGKTEKM